MNIPPLLHIIIIHIPTIVLAATLIYFFRILRSTATNRPERAILFTAEDTTTEWENETRIWEQRLRILRQIASINAICLSACVVTLLFTYTFPAPLVGAFTIAYLLVITPYLLKKIPVLETALKLTFSPQS